MRLSQLLRQAAPAPAVYEKQLWDENQRGHKTGYFVVGDTFKYKEQLKRLGLRWSPTEKAWWTFDNTLAQKALAVLKGSSSSPSPSPSSSGKASPKQVDYALALLAKLGAHGWFDSDLGEGGAPMPRRRDLEAMSSSAIGEVITSLRAEF